MRFLAIALAAAIYCPCLAQAQSHTRPAPPDPESLAQQGRPGWTVDARNGCWVWNPNPQPDDTVNWNGPCPRGPAQGEGDGEWLYAEDGQSHAARFNGTLREGRVQGVGKFAWTNGNRYDGELRDSRPEGYGEAYVAAHQRWYRGQWTGGCFRGADRAHIAINRPLSECQ